MIMALYIVAPYFIRLVDQRKSNFSYLASQNSRLATPWQNRDDEPGGCRSRRSSKLAHLRCCLILRRSNKYTAFPLPRKEDHNQPDGSNAQES
jgi:hypothetical protein